MSMSHSKIIEHFKEGRDKHPSGSSLFAELGVLYSWGKHFPLAVHRLSESNLVDNQPWVLLNGDSRSSSTQRHQRMTFRTFPKQPRVSFDCLRLAGLDYNKVRLIHFTEDIHQSVVSGEEGFEGFERTMLPGATFYTYKETGKYGEVDGDWVPLPREQWKTTTTKGYHRVGCVVLEWDGSYYLCAADNREYFISHLPHPVTTVDAAFQALKPHAVKVAEREEPIVLKVFKSKFSSYKVEKVLPTVIRQGEWFMVPRPDIKIKDSMLQKDYALPHEPRSNIHSATRGGAFTDLETMQVHHYVKGTLRHSAYQRRGWGREEGHRMARLGHELVWEAHCSLALRSWTAEGRVD